MNDEKKYTFGEPIEKIIRKRKSVRTYSRLPIQEEVKENILQYFKQLKGPYPVEIRFQLIDRLKIRTEEKIKLGTYGMIQGASFFIASAVRNEDHYLEQLGYIFEKLILFITSRGLGTCWMAGTFNKSEFSKAMRIEKDEILPIVTPIGYESWIKSPIDLFIKPIPALKIRKPWNSLFFKNDFSTILQRVDAGSYTMPLEMVRLAPSASNKQPWRIVYGSECFHFYLAHDAVYAYRYLYDIQKIDMGIAMCHFESMANELGLKGRWEIQAPVINNVPKGSEYVITWRTN